MSKVDQAVETLAELISEGCAKGGRRHRALRDLVGEIGRLKLGEGDRADLGGGLMVARGDFRGHEVVWDGEKWVISATGEYYDVYRDDVACLRCGLRPQMLPLGTGTHGERLDLPVDACIADLVAALNSGGQRTTGSCCGHGIRRGYILLADGRRLRMDPGDT